MTFSRVNAGGWASGAEVTTTQFTALDTDLSNALDKSAAGDGVFGPIVVTSAITAIGGATFITAGGSLQTLSGGRVRLGDNDYPQFSAARSLTRLLPILFQQNGNLNFVVDQNYSSANVVGASGSLDLSTELIDGATLATVAVIFGVPYHTAVPAVMPLLAIVQVATATGAQSTLVSASIPKPITAAIWTANQLVQTFTLTVGAVIDRTQYNYYLRVVDESGAGAQGGNQWALAQMLMTNITSMRPA